MAGLPVLRIIDPPSNNTNSRTLCLTLLYNFFSIRISRTWSDCHSCKTILCKTKKNLLSIIDLYKRTVVSCFDMWFDYLSLDDAGERFGCVFWIWILEGQRSAKLKPFGGFLRLSSVSLSVWWLFISFLNAGHGRKMFQVFGDGTTSSRVFLYLEIITVTTVSKGRFLCIRFFRVLTI